MGLTSSLPARLGGLPVYLLTATLARLANEGLKLALILAAAASPGGIRLGGMLVAAFLIPAVIAAPFVGRLADTSTNPTRLYSLAFAFNGATIAGAGLLLQTDVHPVIILVLAALGGTVGPLLQGGLSALVGSIVPKDALHRGYALDVVTYNVSAILAPAIVAAIAGFISPLASVMILAALMLSASLTVTSIPMRRKGTAASLPVSSPLDGLKAIGTIVPLRSTATATSIANISNGVLPVAATLLAADRFSVNAGVLLSTMAVGALVGSLSYAARPFGTDKPELLVPVIALIVAIPIGFIALTGSTPLALVFFALAGFLGGPQGAAQFSVRDRFSPPPVRTQVFTLSTSLKTTFAALGSALAGFIAGAPPSVMLTIAVAANIIGGTIALADLARHRGDMPLRQDEPTHVTATETAD
ncbi:MAG TPA: MFS transporter [Thermomicrobiales bacterium]|nr:MFS transporter [Thermomicrobiales bacterium]